MRPEPFPQFELASKTKVMSLSREYATDLRTLLHATADFKYRSRWQEGVRTVEKVGHFLPRVGMKCRCVLDDGEVVIYSSSYSYSPDKVSFSETDEKKKISTYFTLEKTGSKKTRLTIDFYLKKNLVRQAWFALTRKGKMQESYRKSLLNLEGLAKELKVPSCA